MPDARTRARRARKAAYREAVLEAAEQCFGERGIDQTKVEEIAAEAGMSLSTLYSVFKGGKAEIADEVHRTRQAALGRFGVEAESSWREPLDAIRTALLQAVEFLVMHRSYLRIHLNEGYAWGMPEAIALHSQAGARSFLAGVGALERVIERGVEQGVFRAGDVRRCARTLVMMKQIHLAAWIDGGERASASEVFADYWADVSRFLGVGKA